MKRAILSPFFVIISRYWLTMPPIECSPDALRARPRSRWSPRSRSAGGRRVAIERMAGDVEAERLLLEREQLLGAPLLELGVASRPAPAPAPALRRLGRGEQAEQRGLAAPPVALLGRAALERAVDRREQLRAVMRCPARPSNAPALTSASSTLRLHFCAVDALAEVEQRRERPVGRARLEDRLDRALADALHRAEAEADRPCSAVRRAR